MDRQRTVCPRLSRFRSSFPAGRGRRRGRGSRGQALVEFVLVAPVALILIGGAVDFGRLFYAQITIADAAREGALWAAQHPNSWMQGCDASQPVGPSNEDQVTCHARNEADGGLVSIGAGNVTCASTPAPGSTACGQDSPAPGGAVYVTVRGQFKTIMGGITFGLSQTAAGRIVQLPAQASAASQSISFGLLADQDVGVGSITVGATATSGLTVTFSTTTPTVCASSGANGSVISVLAVGTCTVVADQAGDGHWSPAASVPQSFQVTAQPPPGPGGQVITFGPLADRVLGSGFPLVSGTASSGLPVSFSTTTQAVCTSAGPDGSTIVLLQVGLCTVKADQPGDATYAAAPPVLQSFNVTAPAPPACAAPILSFTITPNTGTAFKNNGHPGTLFAFDASGSTIDANCHPVWSWNFGNAAGTSSTPVQTTYTYPVAAPLPSRQFTVTLTVTVDGGAAGTTTATVRVNPG